MSVAAIKRITQKTLYNHLTVGNRHRRFHDEEIFGGAAVEISFYLRFFPSASSQKIRFLVADVSMCCRVGYIVLNDWQQSSE